MDDLGDLVPAFVAEFNALSGKRVTEIPGAVWERLEGYSWPGNIRELRNVLERSVLLAETNTLSVRWLQLPKEEALGPSSAILEGGDALSVPLDGSQTLDEIEARVIREALDRCRLNVTAAAHLLGITRQTLRYRIEKHRIDVKPQ
jgi:transcriptional regulator with PAS, ATPase and Fis domain